MALATIFGQAIVMALALAFVPGASFDSFWTAVAAAWIAAAFGTFLVWILSAGTDESFVASLLRIRPGEVPDAEVDGVLFVQLDGVSFPVMEWALQSGTMPTLRRWVDAGSHTAHEWTVQIPCTTPASQQALLQGTAAGVPAFRWYDRELGRVLIANRPEDAAIIEARASTGHGLLADDGVSISNVFTGDAPKAAMTMSRLEVTPRIAPDPTGVRAFPRCVPTGCPGACAEPSRRSCAKDSRLCVRSGSVSIPGCTGPGRSPASAPSATGCSGTSTPRWSPRR